MAYWAASHTGLHDVPAAWMDSGGGWALRPKLRLSALGSEVAVTQRRAALNAVLLQMLVLLCDVGWAAAV